jgi:hypothetical protein
VQYIDCREHSLFRHAAIKMQLHIARSLELLINEIVHTAAGIDEAGGDDGQAASLLGIAGSAEKAFRRVKRNGIDTAGKRPAAGRHCEVVRPGQTGNAVQQDNDILADFDKPLGAVERQFCNARMSLGRLIKGCGNDLAFNRTLHIGHFLRPFADKTNHHMNVRVFTGNSVRYILHQHGFTCFRR